MTFNIEYEARKPLDFDYEQLIQSVIAMALEKEQCPYEAEVNVILTNDEQIHEINQEYRSIDRPTDVLSFPLLDYQTPGNFEGIEDHIEDYFNLETGELMLGDIIISVDKVYEQAESYGHSIQRELAFLVAHSMFHLMGYDHIKEEDKKKMRPKEEKILNQLGIKRDEIDEK